jgi:hypothetical protein
METHKDANSGIQDDLAHVAGLPTMVKTTSEAAVTRCPFMTVIVGLGAVSR